jgi:leucyl aminopeptidase
MQISFVKSAPPKGGTHVLFVFEDELKSGRFAVYDAATEGALARAAATTGFVGKKDQSLDLMAPAGNGAARILAIGVGKNREFDARRAEAAGGRAAARLLSGREKAAAFVVGGLASKAVGADEAAARAAYGAVLRAYRFDKYKTVVDTDHKPQLARISLHGAGAQAKTMFAECSAIAAGVAFARDLASEPPNVLFPESFAARCKELESLGVKVTILGVKEMTKLGMGSLLGVGQGSARESKLVAMHWTGGAKNGPTVALVGKGVCFDSGGISLKPGPGMEDMKWDMGGAGAVAGAMKALAGRKAKANVVGVIGLVENMPDGNAQRPSDVVKSMSGQTIEILNTDAEGRLVLADAVWWTQEIFKPKTLVDLATLTGAIIISLAHEYAGAFSRDDKLVGQLIAAGEAVGEKLWRMPLAKAHDEMLKSDIADMKNIGPREGGSSTAAAFIGRFIKKDVSWAHLDIAGVAWSKKDRPTCPKGATAFGVRLLDQWIRANHEK